MGEVDVDTARAALADHPAFTTDGDAYVVETSPFETRVAVRGADGIARVDVEVVVPTLDAAVTGETVAAIVEEGWFETFSLRLEDVGAATRTDPDPPSIRLAAEGRVVVETTFTVDRSGIAAEDAKAIVDYVEGTYVEGIIPGYEYGDPVTGLVSRARAAGSDREPAA